MGYYAYFGGPAYGFNGYEALASLLFWYGVVFLVFRFPLYSTLDVFMRHIRSKVGVTAATLYVVFHLLLYGFILEAILTRLYAPSFGGVPAAVFVNTNLVEPLTFTNILLGLTYNPSVTLSVPPIFGAVLSVYSFSAALIIAELVVANIGAIREVGSCSIATKSRAYVALPALGAVLGASCCISPPVLLALFAPVTAAVTYSLPAYYVTYFTFPSLAIAALYLNLRSTMKLVHQVTVTHGQAT